MAEARLTELERIVAEQRALIDLRPTALHVKEELDKRLQLLEKLIDKMPASVESEKKSKTKKTAQHRPKCWIGLKDKANFVEFSNALKIWAEVFRDDGVAILEQYEASKTPVTPDMLDKNKYLKIEKFDKSLYTELVSCLLGEPSKFITNQRRGQGIAAWREVARFYDSRSQVDKSAAYAKISHPQRRAKTIGEAIELMNVWESLVNNYDTCHEAISDIAKITALKQILPESVLQGFRGKMYDSYLLYKQDINNYINDKHTVTTSTRTSSSEHHED